MAFCSCNLTSLVAYSSDEIFIKIIRVDEDNIWNQSERKEKIRVGKERTAVQLQCIIPQ